MIQAKEKKRILLDEVDIDWEITERQTIVFRKMWEEGKSIFEISKKLRLDTDVIALLIFEQAKLGHIEQRKHGIFE